MHTIGVFDSGIGGLSVANAIEQALPNDKVIFVNDEKNVPYGTKTPETLLALVVPILEGLVDQGCEVIVIACNTVSTTLINELREKISVPLIAMEPMVKPASEKTQSKIIAVCATPTTLGSKRYAYLKETYAKDIKVIEPDCSDWTSMIENNEVDVEKITKQINDACESGADVIVLGCTHYHWIEDLINNVAGSRAVVIQPEQPVIEQLKRVLEQL
jgi:glutamate racemase